MSNPLPKAMPKSKATNEPYRKVKITMWDDPKFRALSPLPPSGQSLFIYLLTSPFTGIIPGLFKGGRAALAEELGWELEAFDSALGEGLALGMVKADLKARVFWLPKAAAHNPPASVNVIKSWARAFELLPECELKWEAWAALQAACYGVSESMGKAYDKAMPLPKDKACPLPSGIQKAVSSKQILNPSLNAGANENSEVAGLPDEPVAPRYVDGLDEPIGKFTMTAAWSPSRDFRQRAAMWGIALPDPDYFVTELAEFASYWESEGKIFTQVQWEQKFARHIVLVRSKKQPETGGKDNAGVRGEPTASRAVQQIQSAHAEWRRRNGLDGNGNGMAPVAGHGGNILEPVDAEEWGGTFGALDSPDRFDD
ncbi:DnaT-like ssDNA-binding domain-containing protein [Leclercia sp.]|uniref:DnaT-like ssDNA-binding domain-containing protein n=1 Tax=Leclercia sp. TaxID=1898428 RepID=UPI0028AA1F7E|nr:DnaT-like ssDNA-binding domain-containing protein [Leclercia sp.]